MPSQTNPTPAPIPPQPRHTLHTLCLHAMCRPIAHHEIVQDRLRLDSTAASPVTDNWLTTEPATLHIHTPRCQINSTLLCCPALLHFDRPTASVNGHGISTHLGPHSSTLQLYNSTLLCCHSLSQISQQQCALSCPAQPCHTRAREAITSKTHASHAVPPCPCAAQLPTMRQPKTDCDNCDSTALPAQSQTTGSPLSLPPYISHSSLPPQLHTLVLSSSPTL